MKASPLFLFFLIIGTFSALLAGCAENTSQRAVALPALKIGIVAAIQPTGTTDLMAGFIPENRTLASPEAMIALDHAILTRLRSTTKRNYTFIPAKFGTDPSSPRSAGQNTALEHWLEVARASNMDMLVVPQILDWQEREGGEAGVTKSAAVNMDFFLVDARNEGQLARRSHFNEKQVGLSSNLMQIGSFFRRGAKWLTANELALEATDQMIREFGL